MCVHKCIHDRCASSMEVFEEAIGSRIDELMFEEVVEPHPDQHTDAEDGAQPDEAERDEPQRGEERGEERDEPQRGKGALRQPLEQEATPAGDYTLPHTCLSRSVYQTMTHKRSVQKQQWHLRASITCSKGNLLVNTSMAISNSHSTSEQESLANTHLDSLILQAVTIKRRKKKSKTQSCMLTNNLVDRTRPERHLNTCTPSPTQFKDAKKDGRSSNGRLKAHGPPGTPTLVPLGALVKQPLHVLLCRHSYQHISPPQDVSIFERRKPS